MIWWPPSNHNRHSAVRYDTIRHPIYRDSHCENKMVVLYNSNIRSQNCLQVSIITSMNKYTWKIYNKQKSMRPKALKVSSYHFNEQINMLLLNQITRHKEYDRAMEACKPVVGRANFHVAYVGPDFVVHSVASKCLTTETKTFGQGHVTRRIMVAVGYNRFSVCRRNPNEWRHTGALNENITVSMAWHGIARDGVTWHVMLGRGTLWCVAYLAMKHIRLPIPVAPFTNMN